MQVAHGFLTKQVHCWDWSVRALCVSVICWSFCCSALSVVPKLNDRFCLSQSGLPDAYSNAAFPFLSPRRAERAALRLEDEWSSSAVSTIHYFFKVERQRIDAVSGTILWQLNCSLNSVPSNKQTGTRGHCHLPWIIVYASASWAAQEAACCA